ncbi:dipicolinate synthase subunit DpsA [Virgibacillus kimchii]
MSRGKNILVLGGDARTLEVITKLAEQEFTVSAAGFEKVRFDLPDIQHTTMKNLKADEFDAILLPVRGTDDHGNVEADYSDESLVLTDSFLKNTKSNCIIYSGTANQYLTDVTHSADRQLIRIFDRDETAIMNAIPTAEGTLMLAIQEMDITVHGSKVTVLGFGRVGMTVAHLFSSVGANVTVAARKAEDLARTRQMGMNGIYLHNVKESIAGTRLCINTVPHPIVNKEMIAAMNPSSLIIDLASGEGGTDFQAAEAHGINALHALGLPGKTAPKSAGKILGNILIELLKDT